MDCLIKIGGSLTPRYILPLYRAIKRNTLKHKSRTYLFPGGGDFADLIRKCRAGLSLSDGATHAMALASLDQNAYLIADMCKCPCVRRTEDIPQACDSPIVIAPYKVLIETAPFTGRNLNIDIFSSTSSALYFAHLLKARFIVATDVDGVFDRDPSGKRGSREPFPELSTAQLRRIKGGGPLDETIPRLMDLYGMETRVVNGKFPQRLVQAIEGRPLDTGTVIRPSRKS